MARLLHTLPPETAHRVAIRALPWLPARRQPELPRLATDLLGLRFSHPIGLAAGFDKNAEAFDALLAQGFAFVEVGTLTPRPQSGNPRPRLFRLPEQRAIINRMGFNNDGVDLAAERLRERNRDCGIVGANIGFNRDADDPVADCVEALRRVCDLVDYVTVNVSSPNTPGLRDWQRRGRLERLLAALIEARADAGACAPGPLLPLFLKVAPDLEPAEEADIARVVLEIGIDGLVVSNTTVARPPDLQGRHRDEVGGLSGPPLLEPSTQLLARMHRRVGRRVALIGVGGVASAADAYAKIRAGASLVQLYTALIYDGPGIALRIARDLDRLLAADGFAHVSEAVGADS
jgi:dihydroorotate dehydrogenase